eukprot:14660193-Ditylum_brightwellii.AAC.1
MAGRKEDIPQDDLQVEDKGPPYATTEALNHWAQNKAKDASEDGAATLCLTSCLLQELAGNIKLIAEKRSAVLAKEKREVLDQQDRPKVCIDCNVACNVLMVCCECMEKTCKDCGHFCTLCEEVCGC